MNQQKSSCDQVIINGILASCDQLIQMPSEADVVYEVIRVISGVPLFIEAHLERMNQSLVLAGFTNRPDINSVKKTVRALTETCSVSQQNIRLNVWQEDGRIQWTGFFVESHYPEPCVYSQGVVTGLLHMERSNPNAKVWQNDLKQAVSQACEARNLYEMILVDSNGFISEGSRSNLFFTCGEKLITAPDESVLEGITRLKLLEIIRRENITLEKREISLSELDSFDGAFITGTSIHLLPVTRIDSWARQSSGQPLIKNLTDKFEELVKHYIDSYLSDL